MKLVRRFFDFSETSEWGLLFRKKMTEWDFKNPEASEEKFRNHAKGVATECMVILAIESIKNVVAFCVICLMIWYIITHISGNWNWLPYDFRK